MKNSKLLLEVGKILQGDFHFSTLNLLLVFQVNCPGCFTHALPVAQKLDEYYRNKKVKVLGLSTAFEDFELNTLENTQSLLDKGTMVGETYKALFAAGHKKFPFKISFDVGFDKLEVQSKEALELDVEAYCTKIEGYAKQPKEQQVYLQKQIRQYLGRKKYRAATFDSNFMQGTPSWVLFDSKLNVFYHEFGHKDFDFLVKIINQHIEG